VLCCANFVWVSQTLNGFLILYLSLEKILCLITVPIVLQVTQNPFPALGNKRHLLRETLTALNDKDKVGEEMHHLKAVVTGVVGIIPKLVAGVAGIIPDPHRGWGILRIPIPYLMTQLALSSICAG
jgi:hypothetical protein